MKKNYGTNLNLPPDIRTKLKIMAFLRKITQTKLMIKLIQEAWEKEDKTYSDPKINTLVRKQIHKYFTELLDKELEDEKNNSS